jgi:glucoamylase
MLGNSSLTVGLNESGLVHDFYYPYVGLDNLTTARISQHKIGVWVDGAFSWIDDGSWLVNVDFENEAMVSNIRAVNSNLGLEIMMHDFVDSILNAFCREVSVINQSEQEREIRVFFHQAFEISSAGRADTALFVPDANYILDYKGRCSLLIYGQDRTGKVFDQYAVGNYGIEGKEGTFRDAEDGELSNSAVEHGGVDSVIRLSNRVSGRQSMTLDYWVVASDSQYNAERVHSIVLRDGLQKRMESTRNFWHSWLDVGAGTLNLLDAKYTNMVKKSLMVIKVHADKHGGIIASCDSSIYNYGRDYYSYVWPRDGAYAIWPLIRLGYTEEPKAFFRFCIDILTDEGYLMHKYQPDKAIGSTWHPLLHNKRRELAIQEDETAVVIFMLGEYYHSSKDKAFVQGAYESLVKPAADFMARFIDKETGLPHASYDLWEEKFSTHTYTVAVVYKALLVAAEMATEFDDKESSEIWRSVAKTILDSSGPLFDTDRQAYRKSIILKEGGDFGYDNTLDVSSMYGAMMYGLHDSQAHTLNRTATLIEQVLLNSTPAGGSPRYEHDNYFLTQPNCLGNPWIVTTLWIAQYFIRVNRSSDSLKLLDWAISHALPSGSLTEQLDAVDGKQKSVNPLVWSHAELINTVLDLALIEHDDEPSANILPND